MCSYKPKLVAFQEANVHILSRTHRRSAFGDGIQNRLQLGGRSGDDPEHLGGGRLLLQVLGDLAIALLKLGVPLLQFLGTPSQVRCRFVSPARSALACVRIVRLGFRRDVDRLERMPLTDYLVAEATLGERPCITQRIGGRQRAVVGHVGDLIPLALEELGVGGAADAGGVLGDQLEHGGGITWRGDDPV